MPQKLLPLRSSAASTTIASILRATKMFLQARGLAQARATAAAAAAAHSTSVVPTPCQLLHRAHSANPVCKSAQLLINSSTSLHATWGSSSTQQSPCCSSSCRQQHSWRCCSSVTPNVAAESQEAASVLQQEGYHQDAAAAAAQQWTVLNFYHLVDIADPDEVSSSWLPLLCYMPMLHAN